MIYDESWAKNTIVKNFTGHLCRIIWTLWGPIFFKSKGILLVSELLLLHLDIKHFSVFFTPWPGDFSKFKKFLKYMNFARVWFSLWREQNARILKQLTQNLVICVGAKADLQGRGWPSVHSRLLHLSDETQQHPGFLKTKSSALLGYILCLKV